MTWWQYANDNPIHTMLYVLLGAIFTSWTIDRVCMHVSRVLRVRVKQVWLERQQ